MTPAVSREEINLPAMHSPADDGIGWITERRFDSVFCRFLHPFHLVKATSPDDADGRRTSSHSARLNWNGPTRASLTVVYRWRVTLLYVTIRSRKCRNFSSRLTAAR